MNTINITKEMFPERNIGTGCTGEVDLSQDSMDGRNKTKHEDDTKENTQSTLKRPETNRGQTKQGKNTSKSKTKDKQINQWTVIIAAYIVTHMSTVEMTRESTIEETIHQALF